MKNLQINQYRWPSITSARACKLLYVPVLIFFLTTCSDFVEVDLPKNQLTSEQVFETKETAEAALRGIYGKMRDDGLLSGSFNGLGYLMGLYTDELDLYALSSTGEAYRDHALLATDPIALGLWNSTYNQIYMANDVIEGVGNSVSLASEDRDQFKGEALFIRAYLHLLLVELYGDIPYITTTDYITNTGVARMPKTLVYNQIIADLILAKDLLPDEDISIGGEKVRPYAAVADAVLARAYLYTEQWALAEAASNRVITEFGVLEPVLNNVFLKDAPGTIWQFKPNSDGDNTSEGSISIFTSGPPLTFALSNSLVNAFEAGTFIQPGDQRKVHWTKRINNSIGIWYHAFKYKQRENTGTSVEYSIQLRLAEQYLIRAEARVQLGDVPGAQQDINSIRNRAGLGNTTATSVDAVLNAILQERRVELFAEHGHRWFDLKRMGRAAEVLAPIKPGWRATDLLLPIPEAELLLNPNLLPQNDGY
ncbi:MAG TPA: RagB/SusD family nutrient uptake outer membrane protein [Flavobacteriaceae bacterium]|jgi:hypothetical protein